ISTSADPEIPISPLRILEPNVLRVTDSLFEVDSLDRDRHRIVECEWGEVIAEIDPVIEVAVTGSAADHHVGHPAERLDGRCPLAYAATREGAVLPMHRDRGASVLT